MSGHRYAKCTVHNWMGHCHEGPAYRDVGCPYCTIDRLRRVIRRTLKRASADYGATCYAIDPRDAKSLSDLVGVKLAGGEEDQ